MDTKNLKNEKLFLDIGSYTYLISACIDNPDLNPQDAVYEKYNSNQRVRYYALRGAIASFFLGFTFLMITVFVGVVSCWSQRTRYIKMTAIFLGIASESI